MLKYSWISVTVLLKLNFVIAQNKVSKTDSLINKKDSLLFDAMKYVSNTDIPIVYLEESASDKNNAIASSVLTAGRDPFFNAVAFNFSSVHYKIRSYDADASDFFINGISMENIDNGIIPYAVWGGLNSVMRNRSINYSLQHNTYSFGAIGSSTFADVRASKQRKQTELEYSYSNRLYNHKIAFTYNSGINKKGWAFSLSGSRRFTNEGYVEGSSFDGWNAFLSIDKKFGFKQTLSLTAMGALIESGRQSSTTKEIFQLTNNHYYNSFWGYQNDQKRNAYVASTQQPIFILSHEYRFNNQSSMNMAASYGFGKRGSSTIDWYNIADPHPDYYRNLPSYYKNIPSLQQQTEQAWKENKELQQINWNNLYNANSSYETFNNINGKRSRYLIGNYVSAIEKFSFNTVLNYQISPTMLFTGGATYQWQRTEYYKQVLDLLGADYYADLNQFAERSFPNNTDVIQNDLNKPNRTVGVGEKYGYDYSIDITKISAWVQTLFTFKKIDWFLAGEISNTQFFRIGHVRNGLFPTNSFGVSSVNEFDNYRLKTGITFKLNGRHYLFANALYQTKAPYYEDVYISPKTRDTKQSNITNEEILSSEIGYIIHAPKLKFRIGGYYTERRNQLNVLSFYHDAYQNFVNYALRNINKTYYGGELGTEIKILRKLSLNIAASYAESVYSSKQNATIYADNTPNSISADTVFAEGYYVGNAPQELYSAGLSYRSDKFWFINISGNYFNRMYANINPIRRTKAAVQDVFYNSDERKNILQQEQLNGAYTIDLFGNWSIKLSKHKKQQKFLVLTVSVNNLLDDTNTISSGSEQLRFDFAAHDVSKFPSKYYYALGRTFYISTAFRF